MIDPKSASEQLLFTTARIEVVYASGATGTGTAFFFRFRHDDTKHLPVVVTNKHVVRGARQGRFLMHRSLGTGAEQRPDGTSFPIELDQFESLWFNHPDQRTDLCAMPIGPILHEAKSGGITPFYKTLDESMIWSDQKMQELRAVESVLMTGYPIGLWDSTNNLPLVRRGITASHPAVDYCGRPDGLVDIACFAGSSGSPILLFDEGSYTDKSGNVIMGSPRIALLGVLSSGPVLRERGDIEMEEIPTVQTPVARVNMMIHLGRYVKAKELLTLGKALLAAIPK